MPGGKDIQTLIQRHDSAALRTMAETAQKQETRMFLALLAEMIDQQRKKSMRWKRTA